VKQEFFIRIVHKLLDRFAPRIAAHLITMLRNFASGLEILRSAGRIAKSLCFSLVTWFLFCASSYCIIKAFHLDIPWHAPLVFQCIMAVGISINVTPGFVGQFQAAAGIGAVLAVPGISYETAIAIGIVTHFLNFISIVVSGVWALSVENMSLFQLTRESLAAEQREEAIEEPEEAESSAL